MLRSSFWDDDERNAGGEVLWLLIGPLVRTMGLGGFHQKQSLDIAHRRIWCRSYRQQSPSGSHEAGKSYSNLQTNRRCGSCGITYIRFWLLHLVKLICIIYLQHIYSSWITFMARNLIRS